MPCLAGIILYAMVYGYYPFNPADPKLPQKMTEGSIAYPPGVPVSHECKDMIQGAPVLVWLPRTVVVVGVGVCCEGGHADCLQPSVRSWPLLPAAAAHPSSPHPPAGVLNPNPEKRVGLDDIFQHAWFVKVGKRGGWVGGWGLHVLSLSHSRERVKQDTVGRLAGAVELHGDATRREARANGPCRLLPLQDLPPGALGMNDW